VKHASGRTAPSLFGWGASAEGHPLITLTGDEGVVSLESWWHEGIPLGVLAIHSKTPLRESQQPDRCPLGGTCYVDVDYKSGFKAAELFLSQREDLAMTVMVTCYRWYLLGERSR
jgi:hypothetical protein